MIILDFLTKYWRITLPAIIIFLLAFVISYQGLRIKNLNSEINIVKIERDNDRLSYEQNLQKIELESQRVLNEVNAKVLEKERVINESWANKLNSVRKENEQLEITVSELSNNTDRLLYSIEQLRKASGSQYGSGQSKGQTSSTSRSNYSGQWNVLSSCIGEYSKMAKDADRVVQDFRLLNDWKEVIITEIVE